MKIRQVYEMNQFLELLRKFISLDPDGPQSRQRLLEEMFREAASCSRGAVLEQTCEVRLGRLYATLQGQMSQSWKQA